MILSANQPYPLPYFPYWQLIHAGDLFLAGDDYTFIKHGWITRNRILVNGQEQFLRLRIKGMSSFKLIRDTELCPFNADTILRTLEMAYHKAPYFNDGFALAQRVFGCPERNLSLFLMASIREVCAYLGIGTKLGCTSELEGNSLFKREERIYDFCHRLGAEQYINPIGGQALYRFDEFRRQGIRLCFLQSHAQLPPLSILDHVMNHSREELHHMLDQYTLIDG